MDILRGAFTAIITPFTADARTIDWDRLDENIRLQSAGGVTGVVPCGTTGESPTLTDEEHKAVVDRAIATGKSNGLVVVAGAGSNDTHHAVALHTFAQSAGADASLQVTPYYNKPSQEGLYRHFMSIADSCDLPIVLYNIPGRSGVPITVDTVERLAAHPNIVAVKDATGSLDNVSETIQRTDLIVLSGDDTLTLPMMAVGAQGVVSVVSNLLPRKVASMCDSALRGDWAGAQSLHHELFGIARALLSLDTNPVPIKAALAHLGIDTGSVRLPLAPASDQVKRQISDLLKSAKIASAEVAVR